MTPLYFGGQEYTGLYIGGQEISQLLAGGQAYHEAVEPISWQQRTFQGTNGYWARMSFSAALSASLTWRFANDPQSGTPNTSRIYKSGVRQNLVRTLRMNKDESGSVDESKSSITADANSGQLSIGSLPTTKAVFLCSSSEFDRIDCYVLGTQGAVAAMQVEIWTGTAWTAVESLSDGSASNGRSLNVDYNAAGGGPTTWTVPSGPAPPAPTGPTHSFSLQVGGRGNSRGYNGIAGSGSIVAGSTASYRTPGGKNVTVIHCRNVGSELNFALSGAAMIASDFPRRIVVTKTSGGEVSRECTPQAGSLRPVQSGFRQDYDPDGRIQDVFAANQTVRADLYY